MGSVPTWGGGNQRSDVVCSTSAEQEAEDCLDPRQKRDTVATGGGSTFLFPTCRVGVVTVTSQDITNSLYW